MPTRAAMALLVALAAVAAAAADAPLLAWRSIDWASPSITFPYERGEIRQAGEATFRIDESFEREVKPLGPVSPQTANFWRFCVISHFTAKRGFAGWALASGPDEKFGSTTSTMYFVVGNAASDVPEKYRSNFDLVSAMQPMCSKFLRPEYQWWR